MNASSFPHRCNFLVAPRLQWLTNGDYTKFEALFDDALWGDFIVKAKVKSEQVADEQRVKTTAYSLHPVDYVKESKDLIKAIKALQ